MDQQLVEPFVRIGVPSTGVWHEKFALSLLDMCMYTMMHSKVTFSVHSRIGSIISQSRNHIVQDALAEEGTTHVLFLDVDQAFPPRTLVQLLSHRLPIVGCNVATRMLPAVPTARLKDPKLPAGAPLRSNDRSSVERVWRLGCGVLLIELTVCRAFGPPWFLDTWKPEVADVQGEDYYFCEQAEANNFGIYVDHGLSQEVYHGGTFWFGHEHVPPQELFDAYRDARGEDGCVDVGVIGSKIAELISKAGGGA